MSLKRLLTEVSRRQSQFKRLNNLVGRPYLIPQKVGGGEAYRLPSSQGRFSSSYVGSFARRVRDANGSSDVAYLKELYSRNDPEAVIRLFENQPSLHSNPRAIAEYVKALIKVDRLDESELLKTLQRGMAGSGNSSFEEESIGGLSAFRNVGKSTKEGVLGTPSAPIHMVTAEGGHFKEQLWCTFRALGLAFLLISGVGALIEDRGISKGNYYFVSPRAFLTLHPILYVN